MKKEAKNINKNIKVKRCSPLKSIFNFSKSSLQKHHIASALKNSFRFALFLLLLAVFVAGADLYPPGKPTHGDLYTDTISRKTDTFPSVIVADNLDVTGDASVIGLVSCNTIDTDASGKLVCGTDEGGGSLWSQIGANIYYNTGNVGIGTTEPGYKLDVYSRARVRDLLYVDNALHFVSSDGIGEINNEVLPYRIVLASPSYPGNVGIGTTTPSEKLDVAGNIKTTGGLIVETGATSYNVGYYGAASSVDLGTRSGTNRIGFFIGGQYKMVINTAGNVGIGTTAPNGILDVQVAGTTRLAVRDLGGVIGTRIFAPYGIHTNINGGGVGNNINYDIVTAGPTFFGGDITLSNSASLRNFYSNGNIDIKSGVGAGTYISLQTSNSEKMRITSAGDVGIGTTSPTANHRLDIEGGNLKVGTSAAQKGITLYDTADGSAHCVRITSDALAVTAGVCA